MVPDPGPRFLGQISGVPEKRSSYFRGRYFRPKTGYARRASPEWKKACWKYRKCNSSAMSTRRAVSVPVPGRSRRRGEGSLALTPAQMTINLPTHLRAAGMEVKRYTMHSFRVGEAAGPNMDGQAMDHLMNTWGGSPQPSHADTYSRGGNVRGSGGSEAFSRNGVHRG